ncbi:MAG TPA: sigma 54-interacting transcriptional regulator [Spirochaetota bacterium]|nr:sigma 54-interacting transcriptional regulator [Spirochaetota bacterium]
METICNERNIILDSIADGVFTVDLDFKITSINRAAEMILGVSEDEVIGKYCFEIFHANICEHSCALKETIRSGKNIINKTIYVVNSEGTQIPVSISTALLKDINGNLIGGVETFRDISDIEELRKTIESKYSYQDIVSKNKKMQDIVSILPDIAESDSSVLIEGASGTGKELIAQGIHNLSPRRDKPIVVINCAALPENLLESELFGYKAGAFTDAKKDKPGKIALAEGGTIFLDEIGELPASTQVKLLRFLQEREYEPLGGIKPIKSDVRIIAATNRILLNELKSGSFREDLYYRLNIITIKLPLLKDRIEDIPLLVSHFVKKYSIIKGKHIEGVSDDVMNILMNYDFPGNIRELENIIEHGFILCKDYYIQTRHLPSHLRSSTFDLPESMTLEMIEKMFIERTLERNDWNKLKSAQDLGIDQSTLWRKIKRYNLTK